MSFGLVISAEMIFILKWILEQKKDVLVKLIKEALEADSSYEMIFKNNAANSLIFNDVILQITELFEEEIEKFFATSEIHFNEDDILKNMQFTNLPKKFLHNLIKKSSKHVTKKEVANKMTKQEMIHEIRLDILKNWNPAKNDASA